MNKFRYWFTLVELIVVITILAILWTIAFISFHWYNLYSRDSARISDIWNMKKTLEFFMLDSWKYPSPTDKSIITYKWADLWEQGKFWDSVVKSVKRISQNH